MHTHTLLHRHIYINTHIQTQLHANSHLNTYKNMHIHKQRNNYAQLQILLSHIKTHSFTHEHIKKIFDQNILNTKIFSRKNIFTVKKLFKKTYRHNKIRTQNHAQRYILQTYQHTHTC